MFAPNFDEPKSSASFGGGKITPTELLAESVFESAGARSRGAVSGTSFAIIGNRQAAGFALPSLGICGQAMDPPRTELTLYLFILAARAKCEQMCKRRAVSSTLSARAPGSAATVHPHAVVARPISPGGKSRRAALADYRWRKTSLPTQACSTSGTITLPSA